MGTWGGEERSRKRNCFKEALPCKKKDRTKRSQKNVKGKKKDTMKRWGVGVEIDRQRRSGGRGQKSAVETRKGLRG